jgi:RIO kinase 1
MLGVGLVHGDLSEFNVLVDSYGPVIIDLPQAVDAAANNNAGWMLERDVNNMTQYYGQFAPELLTTQFAKEIWALYQAGDFDPEAELTGEYQAPTAAADVDAVLDEIKAAFAQMQERQLRQQEQDDD